MFRAIGEVDEAMLQDAVAAAARPVKRRPPVRFGAGLATAACAALLAAAVLGAVAAVYAVKVAERHGTALRGVDGRQALVNLHWLSVPFAK